MSTEQAPKPSPALFAGQNSHPPESAEQLEAALAARVKEQVAAVFAQDLTQRPAGYAEIYGQLATELESAD